MEVLQRYIIQVCKKHDFDLSQIGNMGKTTTSFDLLSNYMVDRKGVKTVFQKTTDHEKFFTSVLCCLANGTRPLTVIFKCKTLPKDAKFPSGVIVHAHEKGWMDEYSTFDWLEKIWN